MNIKINSHSSIQIDDNIYFDPFNITAGMPVAKMIFITHPHYDHFSPEDIKKVADSSTIIITTKGNSEAEMLPHSKIIYVSPYDEFNEDDIHVKVLPAYNKDKKFHPKENAWVGYKLTIDDETYIVAGDTDATDELASEKTDALILPIGGTYTMNAEEAADLANRMMPKLVVPSHYNAIVGDKNDEAKFVSLLNPKIKCRILID